MRIHSNEIMRPHLVAAAQAAGIELAFCEKAGSRKRSHAYEVTLSGSSRYATQSNGVPRGTKAATWDEWGIFLMRLFDLDCTMIAGPYNGRAEFLKQTREAVEHARNYERIVGRKRPGMEGPWLRPMAGESREAFEAATRAAA